MRRVALFLYKINLIKIKALCNVLKLARYNFAANGKIIPLCRR
ncbi:hypothetical protein HMPREF9554_01567 [Treponema phagedenis F0421]|nr:hypothetical protein HMPREF9554_01567 [Treponema phagedenis F0421]